MPSPRTKKLIVLAVAIVLIGSMVLANAPAGTQQGQLRNSGGAPAHVTIKQYLPQGTSEKSARVVEVSPYCVSDWAVAGQWTLSVTQPFKLEGLPFFAKKFGALGEDSRLGREFALLLSTNPDDPSSVLGEASNSDSGVRATENLWLEFAEGVDLEPGDYYLTLLFGPDYLAGKLDTTYNATVSLDKDTQTPAWGRFLEGNVKVTRKSELLTFGKLSFPLKIDQKVADHNLPECQGGDWVALTDDEYYGVEEEVIEEEFLEGEEWLDEGGWNDGEWSDEWLEGEEWWAEEGWDERSENLLESFEQSADQAVWVEDESVEAGAGEPEVETKQEEAAKSAEPVKAAEPVKIVEPAKSAKPTQTPEPTKTTESVKATEPIKTSTSGTSGTTDSKDTKNSTGIGTTSTSTQESKPRTR